MSIKRVIVFGLGAAGSNTINHLACVHPELEYVGVDMPNEKVELRNVEPGTQPYSKQDIGRPKTQAYQRHLMVSRGIKMTPVNKKIETKKDAIDIIGDPESVLIIDAFDNALSRNILSELGDKYNVLHIGFSAGLTGEVCWNENYGTMKEDPSDATIDVCEMHLARPFIMVLTSLAATVVSEFIVEGNKKNILWVHPSFQVVTF